LSLGLLVHKTVLLLKIMLILLYNENRKNSRFGSFFFRAVSLYFCILKQVQDDSCWVI